MSISNLSYDLPHKKSILKSYPHRVLIRGNQELFDTPGELVLNGAYGTFTKWYNDLKEPIVIYYFAEEKDALMFRLRWS